MKKPTNRIVIQNYIQAVPIPFHATNGDVIKAIFPEVQVNRNGFIVEVELEAFGFNVEEDWWDASYGESNPAFRD